jgi:DNA-binding CsgD family transcriptional regulator
MKSIVRQKHIEWLEQQIETCQSVINNQALRKITLIEALENAKGNSGSATLVEVPTATATATAQAKAKVRTVKGLTKAERKIWRLLGNTDLSSAELAQKAKLKLNTVHSTIWSLRKKLGFSAIVLKNGRYTLAGEFQRTGS